MRTNNSERYLKYTPSEEERKELGKIFWEIWQGLPDFPYKESESSGGPMGLYYESPTKETYVWVNPVGYSAFKANPNSVFLVMMRHRDGKNFRAADVDRTDRTLEEAIEHAKTHNHRMIIEKRETAAKTAHKRGTK